MSLGTVIALPFSGFLAEALGWEYVFYVQGGLGALWLVLWILCVYDSPQEHPFIHPDELELYSSSTSSSGAGKKVDNDGQISLQLFNNLLRLKKKKNLPVPWKAIFTSVPFWAILIAHTCSNFGWYMLLVELPTYMKHILRFNIGQVKSNLTILQEVKINLFLIAERATFGCSVPLLMDFQCYLE